MFGFATYTLIHDQTIKKIDDNASPMTLARNHTVGDYMLFDPIGKQTVTSRDVTIVELDE